jgi:hypothetical protein
VEVNGKKILNLRDLIETVEADSAVPYVVFKTEDNESIVLERKKTEEAHKEILSIYQIADDRSSDLKETATGDNADGKKIARSDAVEAEDLKQ